MLLDVYPCTKDCLCVCECFCRSERQHFVLWRPITSAIPFKGLFRLTERENKRSQGGRHSLLTEKSPLPAQNVYAWVGVYLCELRLKWQVHFWGGEGVLCFGDEKALLHEPSVTSLLLPILLPYFYVIYPGTWMPLAAHTFPFFFVPLRVVFTPPPSPAHNLINSPHQQKLLTVSSLFHNTPTSAKELLCLGCKEHVQYIRSLSLIHMYTHTHRCTRTRRSGSERWSSWERPAWGSGVSVQLWFRSEGSRDGRLLCSLFIWSRSHYCCLLVVFIHRHRTDVPWYNRTMRMFLSVCSSLCECKKERKGVHIMWLETMSVYNAQ